MVKNAAIVILSAFAIAMVVLCHNWSVAYETLQAEHQEVLNPGQHRADIYVLTNGDVWTLFDGRWVFEFKGACANLIREKKNYL